MKQKPLTFKHKWQPHITVITTLQAGVKINICHLKKMEERKKSVGSRRARRCSLWGEGRGPRGRVEGRGYLGLAPGLQLVLVAAQPLVVEADVFGQRADLLQPHPLREGALNAVALVDHFTLAQQQTNKQMTRMPTWRF